MAENLSQSNGWDGIKKPPGLETEFKTVLFVGLNDDDCASLRHILKSGWAVVRRATIASASSRLRDLRIPIVICDCDSCIVPWNEMLNQLSLLPDPPLFIVSSRQADERLWAEALNLGAWDVLAKPFDAEEVTRIVGIAGLHWQDRHGVYVSRKQRTSADGTQYLAATGT